MPIKPWSISTTVRNPDRLRGFLGVLAQMEGAKWDNTAQVEFQIRLVQERLYGSWGLEFYADMPRNESIALQLTPTIPRATAERMFASAKFKDAPLRGRRLFSRLQWCGFANIQNGRIAVTDLGRNLLAEERDYSDIVLQILMKWQIPNPLDQAKFPASRGYNIKPFIGFLRLILEINRLCKLSGMQARGVSLDECGIFALTMIDWRDIEKTARETASFRRHFEKISLRNRKKFVSRRARASRPDFNLGGVDGKVAETVQYFRMTGITCYEQDKSGAWWVNVSPFRNAEISALLRYDNAAPVRCISAAEYKAHLGTATPLYGIRE